MGKVLIWFVIIISIVVLYCLIYWSEYNSVKENGSTELREMPDYLDQDRPSFEARA